VEALKTPIGYVPYSADIDMTGLNLSEGALEKLLQVESKDWLEELKGIKKFFNQFKRDMPAQLWDECENLEKRLKLDV